MHDLNDLAYFASVADHRGFAAASRALGIPKSRLSRRISALETRLGTRLLQRTTRRFAVTETGHAFLQHCHAMLAEAEAAEALVAEQARSPRGEVILSCPPALLQAAVGPMLTTLMATWPQIVLRVKATNQPVDVWEGGVDLALRVRSPDTPLPAEETVRVLAISHHLLVAAPGLLASAGTPDSPQTLAKLPTLAQRQDENIWTLSSLQQEGQPVQVAHRPRLFIDDMAVLRCAALAGVGCAILPRLLIHDDLEQGRLHMLLPGWQVAPGHIQAVFATRRHMRPAVRRILEGLADGFATLARQGRCMTARD